LHRDSTVHIEVLNTTALGNIGTERRSENLLEGLATDHNRVHAGYAFVVFVGFAAALWQKIEIAVGSCNEAVNAAADKNSYRLRRFLAAKL
jgi:hypothetical protein